MWVCDREKGRESKERFRKFTNTNTNKSANES